MENISEFESLGMCVSWEKGWSLRSTVIPIRYNQILWDDFQYESRQMKYMHQLLCNSLDTDFFSQPHLHTWNFISQQLPNIDSMRLHAYDSATYCVFRQISSMAHDSHVDINVR